MDDHMDMGRAAEAPAGSPEVSEDLLAEQKRNRSTNPELDGQEELYSCDHDEEDPTVEQDAEGGSIGEHSPAMRSFFLQRLEQTVVKFGGHSSILEGWRVEVHKRTGGLALGLIDVFYCNPLNKKFRSRIDALGGLGILHGTRTLRNMPKEHLYDMASESREKLLLAQQLQLGLHRGPCAHIELKDDQIILSFAEPASPSSFSFMHSVRPYFAVGNITVLAWGQIVPDVAFHTPTQIYPIGFKCLRQEHDVLYDRIVDCLCEIDSVQDGDRHIPLFRISVAWVGEQNQPFVRVYEAKSPQIAWQAAMLEPLGLDSMPYLLPMDESSTEVDEEEQQLRHELREMRRDYFRALRSEQSVGLQGALKPRLSIDSMEGFGDDIVLRLIEGMRNADLCENYQFLDSRMRDGGRKHIIRCLARMHDMSKQIEKVYKKTTVKDIVKETAESRKRERVEAQETKKRIKQEIRENKAQKLTIVANQKQKLKDLDKAVRSARESLIKVILPLCQVLVTSSRS